MEPRASITIQSVKAKPHIAAVYSASPTEQLIAFPASLPDVRSVCVFQKFERLRWIIQADQQILGLHDEWMLMLLT